MLLFFGSVNLDHSSFVTALPRPGETVMGHDLVISPGGKGANQAFNAVKMGSPTLLVAAVGEDLQAENALAQLKSAGVDLEQVKRYSDIPTGFASISIDQSGENSIIVIPGANAQLKADSVSDSALANASHLVTQMEVDLKETMGLIQRAHEKGLKTIHSLAPFAPIPSSLLKSIDYLLLNETEATDLIQLLSQDEEGLSDPAAIARRFNMDLIITRGADGVLHLDSHGDERVYAANRIKPIDTTGAGDCFAGSFAALLDQGKSTSDAIKMAMKAAALHCLEKGAQPDAPTFADLH